MADVYVYFLKKIPFRVRIKNEWWEVKFIRGIKDHSAIWAVCETNPRNLSLIGAKTGMIERALGVGIHIKGGTPERGFVTELRRQGYVRLSSKFMDYT